MPGLAIGGKFILITAMSRIAENVKPIFWIKYYFIATLMWLNLCLVLRKPCYPEVTSFFLVFKPSDVLVLLTLIAKKQGEVAVTIKWKVHEISVVVIATCQHS